MKCPYCGSLETRVLDSRLAQSGEVTRRRRLCGVCDHRYTTYERVERSLPLVVKKGGERESFDREKIARGVRLASAKRSISGEVIEQLIDGVEAWAAEQSEPEIATSRIGEQIMLRLQHLDRVAYVRFASVYREFKDVEEFVQTLSPWLSNTHPTSS